MKEIYLLLILLVSITLLQGCKKIEVTNEEAELIFGDWDFVHSSGGFFGVGDSQTYKPGEWINFSEKGILTVHKLNGKKQKIKFKLGIEKSMIDHQMHPMIYYHGGLGIKESFSITGGDTLVTIQEVSDAFIYVFIRR